MDSSNSLTGSPVVVNWAAESQDLAPANNTPPRTAGSSTAANLGGLAAVTSLTQTFNVGGAAATQALGLKLFLAAPASAHPILTYFTATSASAAAAATLPPAALVVSNVAAGVTIYAGVKYLVLPGAKLAGRGIIAAGRGTVAAAAAVTGVLHPARIEVPKAPEN
jgi:hypothetical protein